jgi:hypothetical protein
MGGKVGVARSRDDSREQIYGRLTVVTTTYVRSLTTGNRAHISVQLVINI